MSQMGRKRMPGSKLPPFTPRGRVKARKEAKAVLMEVDQAEILVLLDHKDQEDFLDPQVYLGKMDLMAPKENRGFQDNLEDQGLLDYQERKDPREKRVKRAMLGCQDFLGQLDSGGIEVVLEPQVFLVKKARKESQLL